MRWTPLTVPSLKTLGVKALEKEKDHWKTKFCGKTVTRAMKILEKFELAKRVHRYETNKERLENKIIHKTNRYFVNPSFFSWRLRGLLKDILPALRYLPLFLLIICHDKIEAKKATIFHQQEQRLIREYENYVPLVFENTLYLEINNVTNVDYARGLDPGGCLNVETFQKRENMIPESVHRVGEALFLTLNGKARLACLDQSAVDKGLNEVKKLRNKSEQEKYAYLFKVALNDMTSRNIIPDWELYKGLCSYYTLSGKEPVVEQPVPLFKKKKPSKGRVAVYHKEYVDRSPSLEEFSALSKNEKARQDLAKLGIFDAEAFFSCGTLKKEDINSPVAPSRISTSGHKEAKDLVQATLKGLGYG